MNIRMLRRDEVLEGLRLTWEVFSQTTMSGYTPEAIEGFREFIKYESVIQKFDNKELFLFGAFADDGLKGVAALTRENHISLLFVKPEEQMKGLEKLLFDQLCYYVGTTGNGKRITVFATPSQATTYQQLGMNSSGVPFTDKGVEYLPFEKIVAGLEKKKSKTGMIVAIIIAVFVLIMILFGVLVSFFVKNVRTAIENQAPSQEEFFTGPEDEDYYPEDDYDFYEEDESVLMGIDEEIKKDLSYEWKDSYYTKEESVSQTSYIDFDVAYPEITGLQDDKVQTKINDAIRETAMQTVNDYHLKPSQEMKEKLLKADNGYIVSYVNYKVTYASEDLLSVVFDEQAFTPESENGKVHLRTVNIGLKDGKVYEAKDIFKLNDKFLEAFRTTMQEEASDEDFLGDYKDDELKAALEGENEILNPEFFIYKKGIEVGYDINPTAESDESGDFDYAWVTAPFSFTQAEAYQSDSEFWDLLNE